MVKGFREVAALSLQEGCLLQEGPPVQRHEHIKVLLVIDKTDVRGAADQRVKVPHEPAAADSALIELKAVVTISEPGPVAVVLAAGRGARCGGRGLLLRSGVDGGVVELITVKQKIGEMYFKPAEDLWDATGVVQAGAVI